VEEERNFRIQRLVTKEIFCQDMTLLQESVVV